MRQRFAAGTTIRPHIAQCHAHAMLCGVVGHHVQLGVGIRQAAVDGDHHRHTELPHVADVMRQMRQPSLKGTQVFLVEHVLGQPTLHLE